MYGGLLMVSRRIWRSCGPFRMSVTKFWSGV